jgi:hypothetical protein
MNISNQAASLLKPQVLDVEDFLRDLARDNEIYYENTPPELKTYWPNRLVGKAAVEALKVRWFNEYIGTIVLARLVEKIDHPKLKMLVGRQVGDEAKHAQVCHARIVQLGGRVEDYEPLPEQLEMYRVLDEVQFPEEFFAGMQFTTEQAGVKRNEQALERFDAETARMFRDAINPDEVFHVQVGWTALRLLCQTQEAQARARAACYRQRNLHREWTRAYRKRMISLGLIRE